LAATANLPHYRAQQSNHSPSFNVCWSSATSCSNQTFTGAGKEQKFVAMVAFVHIDLNSNVTCADGIGLSKPTDTAEPLVFAKTNWSSSLRANCQSPARRHPDFQLPIAESIFAVKRRALFGR